MGMNNFFTPRNYGYHYSFNGIDLVSNIVFSAFFAFFAVCLVAYLVIYIFESLGYYQVLKNRGYNKSYRAFIPYLRTYVKGAIADDINIKFHKKTSYALILGFTSAFDFILTLALCVSFFIAAPFLVFLFFNFLFIIKTIATVFKLFSLNLFYKDYQNKNQFTLIIVSIFIPLLPPIAVYLSKDIKPISLGGNGNNYHDDNANYTAYKY